MEEQFIVRVPPAVAERIERLLNDTSSSEDKNLDLSFSDDGRTGTFVIGKLILLVEILGRSCLSICCVATKVHDSLLYFRLSFMPVSGLSDEEAKCTACGDKAETAYHLFFQCSLAHCVWTDILLWLKIPTALQFGIRDHFHQFSNLLPSKKDNKISIGLWICVVSVLWKWRNNTVFENGVWDRGKIVDEVRGRFWSWVSSRNMIKPQYSQFRSWLLDPLSTIIC